MSALEVRANDNRTYHYQARSQPYQQDNTEGRFGAKTAPTWDSLADEFALAQAPVLEGIADLRRIFEDYFARCEQVFTDWEGRE